MTESTILAAEHGQSKQEALRARTSEIFLSALRIRGLLEAAYFALEENQLDSAHAVLFAAKREATELVQKADRLDSGEFRGVTL